MNTQPKKQSPILKLHRTQESKKVSVDDGYTQIPNELLEAILGADLTSSEIKLILFVYRKTVGWHKEIDWICDEQIAEGCSFRDHKEANRVKNNLINREILIKQGRKIGLNLLVSLWRDKIQNNSEIRKISENNPKNFGKKSDKLPTTKETITKEKINNPLPPSGQSAVADEQAGDIAENSANPTACKKNRKAQKPSLDYQAFADLYNQANEASGSRLPMCETINDKRKRALSKLASAFAEKNLEPLHAAQRYFEALFANIRPFHLGENGGWKANFDWAIRVDTLLKVREGAL